MATFGKAASSRLSSYYFELRLIQMKLGALLTLVQKRVKIIFLDIGVRRQFWEVVYSKIHPFIVYSSRILM